MSEAELTHIGGPTLLIEVDGWRILTDPTFDPAAASTTSVGERLRARPRGRRSRRRRSGPSTPSWSATTSTTTTSTPRGRKLLPSAGTVVATAAGARRLGGNAVGLKPWETTTLEAAGKPPIAVTATPCRHRRR